MLFTFYLVKFVLVAMSISSRICTIGGSSVNKTVEVGHIWCVEWSFHQVYDAKLI